MRSLRVVGGPLTALAIVLAAGGCDARGASLQAPESLTDSSFAALSTRLSEPGGFFDTDNLISNEDSYLHAVSQLRDARVEGGTYVGVGPDQNFSYIAAIHPNVAFIVDIRRDNLVEQLLFKAIFALAHNRAEYLALLFGRAAPRDSSGWGEKPVDSLLAWVDRAPRDSSTRGRIMARLRASRINLTPADLATAERFHATFMAAGPGLRFSSFGRAPMPYYPDFRQLAEEKDRDGEEASFLADEDAFRNVKRLEDRNLVIPVVGDFAGSHALATLADWMRSHHEILSAFYTSNVEQYLFRDGGFKRFAMSVARMPRAPNAVIIRSCFVCFGGHPAAMQGYHAVQVVQFVDRFVALQGAGKLDSYRTLVATDFVVP